MNHFLILSAFLIGSLCGAQPIDLGSRRELFVDGFIIERLDGIELELQQPRSGGVAIHYADGAIAGHNTHFTTVFKDGPVYRMYYRGYDPIRPTGNGYATGKTCYAESVDGIHWRRPNLGLLPISNGSVDNNIVMPFGDSLSPFVDSRDGVPPSERYKAVMEVPSEANIGQIEEIGADKVGFNSGEIFMAHGMLGFTSADAIRWHLISDKPVAPRDPDLFNHFDGHNTVFWSEVEQQYVMYQRHGVGGELRDGGIRSVARSTSPDFLHWSKPEPMTFSDTGGARPEQNVYVNNTQPYFRAPHIYVALSGRYMANRQALTERQARTISADNFGGNGPGSISDTVLLTTRAGSNRYEFTFKESFVRPGIGYGNWTSRSNFAAVGIVPTGQNEMSFYVQRNYMQKNAHLERMVLRLDGFASASAPYDGGELLTKPFTFEGRALEINYATSAAGSIKVELQDASGRPIEGFTLEECPEIIGDEIKRYVTWESGKDLSTLAGQPVRLRFRMHDADLFSFRFEP